MKNIFQGLVGAALLAASLIGPATAQMAESLKHQCHSAKELGATIVTAQELGQLEALMKDPSVKVLCLQLWPESMNEARARALVDWVRSGKTVWFYDARLGPWFGFEPCFLTKDRFRNKPENGQLGGKEVPGVATVGLNISDHELNTGVGQVSLFLPRLGEEQYGTVSVKADTVGLLRWAPDSPSLAAMRREGRGAILFKPLLWPDALSGERFQSNVLEWSAGFEILAPGGEGHLGHPPGPKAVYVEGNPATPLFQGLSGVNSTASTNVTVNASHPYSATPANASIASVQRGDDRVESVEDGVLVGRVVNETFVFETASQSLKMPRKDVKQIVLGGSKGLDSLQTWDGQVRKGILMLPTLKIEVAGQLRTISKKSLQKIQFEAPGAPEPKIQSSP